MITLAGRGRPKGSKAIRDGVKTLSQDDVASTHVNELRKKYNELAESYRAIQERNLLYCPVCDKFHARSAFYDDKRYGSGVYPECKEALKKQALDYDKKTDTYKDNRDKTIEVFRKLDLPFIQTLYDRAITQLEEDVDGRGIRGGTAYGSTLTTVKSLPPYNAWTFRQSQYDDTARYESDEIREARPEIKKLFGDGFTESDYIFLQDKYDDFNQRTMVDSISQEQYVILICFNLLSQWKAQKAGQDVKDLVRSYNDLMAAANLQPKQNVGNAATDALSFGQLIEKWEQEEPIPEPDPEFKDVDGIGKYIRVWFYGHLCKALGIKNSYSKEYEEEIGKYTVEKPEDSDNQENIEIYEKLFGKAEE